MVKWLTMKDTEDVEDADYITEVPITFGDTSKNYTINNVPPGIYYIGGAVDLPTVGEYDPEFDWLGTFGSVDILSDPPNAPVFSENTVFDFQLDQPWGGGD